MYGAIGDGITDDTQALNDALSSGKNVYCVGKSYKISSSIYINNSCIFEDANLIVDPSNGTIRRAIIVNECSNVLINRVNISSSAIYTAVVTDQNHPNTTEAKSSNVYGVSVFKSTNIQITNITTDYLHEVIFINGSSENLCDNILIENITAQHTCATSFYFGNCIYAKMQNVRAEQDADAFLGSHFVYAGNGVETLDVNDCKFTSQGISEAMFSLGSSDPTDISTHNLNFNNIEVVGAVPFEANNRGNIVVKNSKFTNIPRYTKSGRGITIGTVIATLNVSFYNCEFFNSDSTAPLIGYDYVTETLYNGKITFRDCHISNFKSLTYTANLLNTEFYNCTGAVTGRILNWLGQIASQFKMQGCYFEMSEAMEYLFSVSGSGVVIGEFIQNTFIGKNTAIIANVGNADATVYLYGNLFFCPNSAGTITKKGTVVSVQTYVNGALYS